MNDNKQIPAIVLGMTATGLSIARSLGRKGIEVFGFDSDRKQPGMFSKYVTPCVCPDVLKEEKAAIDYLIEFATIIKGRPILFCAGDEYVAFLSRNREKFSQYFKFNIPSAETVEDFLDKRRSYAIARRYSLKCPATYFVEKPEDLQALNKQISFPCGLKPAISHLWRSKFGGKKLIVVNSGEELLSKFTEIQKIYPQIMIQELIPGKDDQIYAFLAYFNEKSEPLAFFIKRKLRQHPIHFGISSFSFSEYNERVKEISLDFLSKIKYKGVGALELKRDSRDNEFKFTELNLRFLISGELAIASGVNLPYIMYRDLAGEEVEKVFSFKNGINLVNLELDIGSFWQYRKAKEITLKEYFGSFFNGKLTHTYFAYDDFRPFLCVCRRFVKTILGKITNKIERIAENLVKRSSGLAVPPKEIMKWGYSLIPLRIRNGDRFFKELEFLEKSQWWSRAELENYQNEKLRELIHHVYDNVPYYNDLFKDRKLTPHDINSSGDLTKLPVLTKGIVRENLHRLKAVNFKDRQLKKLYTTGTTGAPLHFYVDRRNEYLTGAPVQWRFFGWGSWKPHDTMAVFDCRAMQPGLNDKKSLFKYDPITKCLFMSIRDLNASTVAQYADALARYNPRFLKGYPSTIELFVRLCKESGIMVQTGFKTIFTNSEILYSWQRSLFEKYFGCRVLDWYALQERVVAAAECGEGDSYHISSEYGILEFVNGRCFDDDTVAYKLIATGLTNFGMPFIRYDTGDLGFLISERCKCGRGLPLMKLHGGRERGFFMTKSGDMLPFTMLNISRVAERVRRLQFVQEEKGKFILKISKDEDFRKEDEERILRMLDETLEGRMDTSIVFTSDFSGPQEFKFQKFVQLMEIH